VVLLRLMKDTYHTISAPAEGEFRDRGSKFIAYAFPVISQEEWQARLEEVRKAHPKARHHCFAYRMGTEGVNYRANDDGEPSGTAGRPILGQIDSFGLTNVFVVVVRYFGGTLLGASGLIQAYKNSTADALQKAVIVEKIVMDRFRLSFDYQWLSPVMNAVKKLEIQIDHQQFEDTAFIDISIRKSDTEAKILQLKSLVAGVHLEEALTLGEIPGFDILPLPLSIPGENAAKTE
jgi:uncharacterized YigZ family protein